MDATGNNANANASDHYPIGKRMPARNMVTDAEGNRYQFTGHEFDEETGFDYHGARYYNSELGRYMNVDPWQEKYLGWSSYNYTMGNPVNYTDPDGKEVIIPKDLNGGSDGVREIRKEIRYRKRNQVGFRAAWRTLRTDGNLHIIRSERYSNNPNRTSGTWMNPPATSVEPVSQGQVESNSQYNRVFNRLSRQATRQGAAAPIASYDWRPVGDVQGAVGTITPRAGQETMNNTTRLSKGPMTMANFQVTGNNFGIADRVQVLTGGGRGNTNLDYDSGPISWNYNSGNIAVGSGTRFLTVRVNDLGNGPVPGSDGSQFNANLTINYQSNIIDVVSQNGRRIARQARRMGAVLNFLN